MATLHPLISLLPLVALLGTGCFGAAAEPPALLTTPSYDSLTPHLSLPPAFEDRLLLYHGFGRADGQAEIRRPTVTQVGTLPVAEGFRDQGALTGNGRLLQVRSPAFSPHGPLTVCFWWAMQEDPKPENCFGLFHLGGKRGIVSHFSRGKGQWCALKRPAAILQVYYFDGIKNVNGIYDRDLLAHVDLRAGVWHHTALVFRGASLVEVYTDGRKAWQARVRGRSFRESDGLRDITIGTRGTPPMAIDEVIVLRRALTPDDIRTYVEAIRQMREVHYP